jgi:hypothetical protein
MAYSGSGVTGVSPRVVSKDVKALLEQTLKQMHSKFKLEDMIKDHVTSSLWRSNTDTDTLPPIELLCRTTKLDNFGGSHESLYEILTAPFRSE